MGVINSLFSYGREFTSFKKTVFDSTREFPTLRSSCSYDLPLLVASAIGGIFGFLASLFGAWIVSYVQSNGCSIFGITIYAQQILSFASFVIFTFAVIYIKKVVFKIKKIS